MMWCISIVMIAATINLFIRISELLEFLEHNTVKNTGESVHRIYFHLCLHWTHFFDRIDRMQMQRQRGLCRQARSKSWADQRTNNNAPKHTSSHLLFACRSVHRVGCSNRQRRRNTQQWIILDLSRWSLLISSLKYDCKRFRRLVGFRHQNLLTLGNPLHFLGSLRVGRFGCVIGSVVWLSSFILPICRG